MPLYKQDPNNSNKQVPNVTPGGTARFSHATCPTNETHNKRPSYITVNKTGTYAFCYVSGSEGTAANYITGSSVQSANAGGVRLDINPTGWRRCDGTDAVGDITFVYVRVM